MAKNDLLFVSTNKQKLAYVEKLLERIPVEVTCQSFQFREFEDDDLFVIAVRKAIEAYDYFSKPVLVMDTGFYIPAYPGKANFPGAFIKKELLEPIGIEGLLKQMEKVENRFCYFEECLVYYDGDNLKEFYGVRDGELSREIYNRNQEGNLTDLWNVFIPHNRTKTLREMTFEERCDLSDGHTEALLDFSSWYQEKKKIKVYKK